jgi:predicted homoserine dehydrogenase-like protein
MTTHTRREFARTLVMAGAATALGATRAAGSNDRIRLGFIGLGNRGDQVLDAFLRHPDAEVVGLCDIHAPYVEFAVAKAGGQP